MHPSNGSRGSSTLNPGGLGPHCTPDAGGSCNAPLRTRLPEATREDQLKRWDIAPERTGDNPPDRGRDSQDLPFRKVRRVYAEDGAAFLQAGGWHFVEPAKGTERGGGTTSHRGVLHPDDYVDQDVLRDLVVRHLGFTQDEIRSVYRQGPLSPEARALRDRIDDRFLEVADSGGQGAELGRALGFPIQADGHCRTVKNALARARARKVAA